MTSFNQPRSQGLSFFPSLEGKKRNPENEVELQQPRWCGRTNRVRQRNDLKERQWTYIPEMTR